MSFIRIIVTLISGAPPSQELSAAPLWHNRLTVRVIWIVLGVAMAAPLLLLPQAEPPRETTASKVIHTVAQQSDRSEPMRLLQTLITRFGPRLTGSEPEQAATAWALEEMKRVGLSHVHREAWKLQRGWRRLRANAQLMKPYRAELPVASYGWSGSTHGAVSGEVVLVDGNAIISESSAQEWTGKIVLIAPPAQDGIREFANLPNLVKWAEKAQALAVIEGIARPGSTTLHTGPIGFPAQESSIPVLDMLESQRQQLEHCVRQGAIPTLLLDVSNQFIDGPAEEANVVGEIEGAVHPEQIVLLGAHLDSWDLSPGTTDDGTGVAALIATADAIHRSGLRPNRTIRFVLFTGEEEGLLGSRAYVEQHREQLQNFVCALVMDWGAGPITQFPLAGHPEMEAPLRDLFAMENTFSSIKTAPGFLMFTDAFAFTLAGLPGLGLLQDSPRYAQDAHSAEDSLPKVDPQALRFNTKVLALAALSLADAPHRPGRMFTRTENEEALRSVRSTLQMLGIGFP